MVIYSVKSGNGGVFFLYGHGGIGKTYIWRALTSSLWFEGRIVLTVALSGIASILLPGGRTTHLRFAIPLDINEDFIYNIKQGSHQAESLRKIDLII